MGNVFIYVNIDEWLDALDAHEGPGIETLLALQSVLASGFAETQALVHVVTGSLKASGRMRTDVFDDEWRGEITYGGVAPGAVKGIVTYAKKEFNRGEDHDAMRNLDLLGGDIVDAMAATVRARLT